MAAHARQNRDKAVKFCRWVARDQFYNFERKPCFSIRHLDGASDFFSIELYGKYPP